MCKKDLIFISVQDRVHISKSRGWVNSSDRYGCVSDSMGAGGGRQVLLELEGLRDLLMIFNTCAFSSWLRYPWGSTQLGKQRHSKGNALAPTEIIHSSHQRNQAPETVGKVTRVTEQVNGSQDEALGSPDWLLPRHILSLVFLTVAERRFGFITSSPWNYLLKAFHIESKSVKLWSYIHKLIFLFSFCTYWQW